jgi:hypothetical protein
MLRAALIATSLAAAMPCFAQEVRVITGDIEHIYGPHAQVLGDADLQARNQRALEHMRAEKQLAIERGQASIEAERQEAALADGMAQNWDNWGSTDDDWYGGWFGPTRGFSPQIGFSRRIGIPPRMGISLKMGFSRR